MLSVTDFNVPTDSLTIPICSSTVSVILLTLAVRNSTLSSTGITWVETSFTVPSIIVMLCFTWASRTMIYTHSAATARSASTFATVRATSMTPFLRSLDGHSGAFDFLCSAFHRACNFLLGIAEQLGEAFFRIVHDFRGL